MKTKTVGVVVVLASVACLILAGCAQRETDPFTKIEPRLMKNGNGVADVWVESPETGATLEGDAAQNVVYIRYSGGKIALPDTAPVFVENEEIQVPIAVYRLVDPQTDLPTDYYKRRFARRE